MKKKAKPDKKLVDVHSCGDAQASGPYVPSVCACNYKVERHIARSMIKSGEAEWVPGSNHTMVCLLDGLKRRTPRSATIDAKHMNRAYILGDLEERERINDYGRLTVKAFAELVVIVPYKDFDRQKAEARGRPVMWFVEDNRTQGGIGETQ